MTFGEKLRHTRLMRGLSQAKLAKRSGVYQTEIYRYEVEGVEPSFANLRTTWPWHWISHQKNCVPMIALFENEELY